MQKKKQKTKKLNDIDATANKKTKQKKPDSDSVTK